VAMGKTRETKFENGLKGEKGKCETDRLKKV
jgi:hypothetical protein